MMNNKHREDAKDEFQKKRFQINEQLCVWKDNGECS